MLVGVTDVGKRLYVCDEYIPGTQLPVGIRQNPVDEILVHVLPYPDGKFCADIEIIAGNPLTTVRFICPWE